MSRAEELERLLDDILELAGKRGFHAEHLAGALHARLLMMAAEAVDNYVVSTAFSGLTTSMLCDSCIRTDVHSRVVGMDMHAVIRGTKAAGRVLPVQHSGSVDIFFEALNNAEPGDVMVIDNLGWSDEGCIGDQVVREAQACGLAGIIVRGCHRDTEELIRLGLPVFSQGSCPAGPQREDPRPEGALRVAFFSVFSVTREDFAFADGDGLVFVHETEVEKVLREAMVIACIERRQSWDAKKGESLRQQFKFNEYLERRAEDPDYTFRRHLREIGAAIEQ